MAGVANAEPRGDLGALLTSAAPGDVIRTKPADFGVIELADLAFEPPVKIEFHKNARVGRIRLRNVTGVTFSGLTLEAGVAVNPVSENAVFVQGGGGVAFVDSTFSWADDGDPENDGTALVFDGVNGATVGNSIFRSVREGVVMRSSRNARIAGSTFERIFEDGVVIAGSSDVAIVDNLCRDFSAVAGVSTHPDCIQLQAGSRAVANNNVVIARNTILKGGGEKAQGIFVSSRFVGEPHENILIENNTIRQSVGLGVFATNVVGLTVRGNLVLPSADAEERPRILVRDYADEVLIVGNTAAAIRAPVHAIVRDNTILE